MLSIAANFKERERARNEQNLVTFLFVELQFHSSDENQIIVSGSGSSPSGVNLLRLPHENSVARISIELDIHAERMPALLEPEEPPLRTHRSDSPKAGVRSDAVDRPSAAEQLLCRILHLKPTDWCRTDSPQAQDNGGLSASTTSAKPASRPQSLATEFDEAAHARTQMVVFRVIEAQSCIGASSPAEAEEPAPPPSPGEPPIGSHSQAPFLPGPLKGSVGNWSGPVVRRFRSG